MMANAKSMINERKTQLSAMMPAPPPKPSLVFIRERERRSMDFLGFLIYWIFLTTVLFDFNQF